MNAAIRRLWARWRPLLGFSGSNDYWKDRYRLGGDSGAGSGGESARYKAEVLNAFVSRHQIRTVVEFGCGDGRQLQLAQYPDYTGYDISAEAIERCRALFRDDSSKRFGLLSDYDGSRADLALSLDVLFHLVEDSVYFDYLQRLFSAGSRYVVIYSSDTDAAPRTLPHVRHRPVSRDVAALVAQDFERIETDLPGAHRVQSEEPPMVFLFYRRSASATAG